MTALDVSDSIVRDEESLEFEGLAKALVGDAVLDAIAGGHHGQIGFAAFAWSSAGRFETVVPWILIGSAADAERAATLLREFELDRRPWAQRGNRSGAAADPAEMLTDISAIIDFAAARRSPRPMSRRAR